MRELAAVGRAADPGPGAAEGETKAPSLDDLPPGGRRLVKDADAAMAKFHEAATEELMARRPGRAVRHQFRMAAE